MKKSLLATAFLVVSASSAHAMVGADIGYNYWHTSDHDDVQSVYGSFEHFVPLVPNAAARYTQVNSNALKFDSYEASAYYRFLENGLVGWNVGLGVRRLDDGELKGRNFSTTLPVVNTEVRLFDDNRTSFYAKMDWGKNSDTDFTDFELGVRMKMFLGIRLQAGYRSYKLNLDGTKGIHDSVNMKGINAGLQWGF